MSKILIVFYSRTGKTKKVSEDITSALGADTEEIIDKKNRKGIMGFLSGGKDAMQKNQTEIFVLRKDPAAYDLVIIGSPVWAGTIVPAIRTYLEANKTKIKNYAFFITSGGDKIEKVVQPVQEIMKKNPAASTGFDTKELTNKKTYDTKLTAFIETIKDNGTK